MKKGIIFFICLLSFFGLRSQTQVNIGPQSSTFTSWVRGYHFTSPVTFTICGLYVPPDASTAAQNVAVVRFTAGPPPAFAATTNAFVTLFSQASWAPNSMIPCNIVVNAGDIIGVYGSRGPTCINSYDGANFATTIMGFPTTLSRSGMQQCLAATPMANIWSEVSFSCGRIFMYYNCCLTPTITANATPTSVCSGMNVALLGGGASTYTWTPGNLVGSTVNVTPTVTTNYTVVGTSTTGCLGSNTVNVTVFPNPTVTAVANPTAICAGKSTTLTAGGGATYTWNPGNLTGTTVSVSPAATTIYTVTGSSVNGCTRTQTVLVTVNPLPVVVPGSNSPVCLGGNINLSVGAATSYTWSGPNSFSSNLQNPTISNATTAMGGIYTVSVTNSTGCVKSNTVNVVINPLPTINPTNTGPYCVGATISLTTAAATTYTWTGPSAFSSNLQNPTIGNAQLVHAGIYSVSVTNAGGCISSGTTNVVVNSLPVPVAGNGGPYCPGNTIQLNVGAFTSYTWSGPASFASNIQNASISSASVANSGTYTVSVTNANGCINTTTTNVVVNPSPVPVIGSNSPVCLNANISLNAAGGTSYAWNGPNSFNSALQNPIINGATTLNAGVYSLTVTSLGCSSTATVNVTVLTPTTSASNTGAYCAGATIQLNTPAANTFTWSGPLGFSSNLQNPSIPASTTGMSGTYSVIVSVGSCTANASTNVVVNALPTPTAQSNSPVCQQGSINLIGNGGTTYTWTGPGGFSSNQQNPVIPNCGLTNSGTNTLTVTDANGCTNSATVNVVVNPLPVIVVNNPTVCVNQAINFSANGGATYSWSGPLGYTSNIQNPVINNATLPMGGAYSVTVTTAAGCSSVAVSNAQVLALPNAQILSNSPVCAGNTLNLMGSGGISYNWSGPGYNGTLQNPTINNVTAAANGVYTLLVSSGSCTASTQYTVVINPVPVFNITNTNVLCNGQSNGTASVTISVGTSPFTFNWNTMPVQNTQNANSLPAGNFSCTVTDANGCTSISGIQITQPSPFTVSISSAVNMACANNPINVNANGSGGTSPYNYNWVSGPTGSSYAIIESAAGNYIYTVNATDANNCAATANINLTFAPQPTVTVNSTTVCAGQTAVLTANGANSYLWQPGNTSGNTYSYNGNNSVNVSVVGTSNGCSNSANTSIIINPAPNVSIATSNTKGCVPVCVSFSATSSSNISNYGWTVNGAGMATGQSGIQCFNEASSYSLGLSVIDNNGCTGIASPVIVDVYPSPVADFNHSPIKPIINQDPLVTFTDASHGAAIVSWNWYFMNNAQFTSTVQNPTFAYTEPGTYAVALVVKSENGCSDTLVKELIVGEDFGIYAPNAFTPNNDGLNDIFQPKGFGVVKYQLQIFDRWGERVFETKSFDQGWDGKFRSKGLDYDKVCEEGVYSWIINVTSVFGKAHELKGHVTLIK